MREELRYPMDRDLRLDDDGDGGLDPEKDWGPVPGVDTDAYEVLLMASGDRRAILRWFTQTRIDAENGIVYAMNPSARDYIKSHFLGHLSACFSSDSRSYDKITFVSDTRLSAPRYKVPLEDIARKRGLAKECGLDEKLARDNREPNWWQRDLYY